MNEIERTTTKDNNENTGSLLPNDELNFCRIPITQFGTFWFLWNKKLWFDKLRSFDFITLKFANNAANAKPIRKHVCHARTKFANIKLVNFRRLITILDQPSHVPPVRQFQLFTCKRHSPFECTNTFSSISNGNTKTGSSFTLESHSVSDFSANHLWRVLCSLLSTAK